MNPYGIMVTNLEMCDIEVPKPKPIVTIEYTDMIGRIRFDIFVEVVNSQLQEKVTTRTYNREINNLKNLIREKKVPEIFHDSVITNSYKYLNWDICCLLWVAMKIKDDRKFQNARSKNITVKQISVNEVKAYLQEKELFRLFYNRWAERDSNGNQVYRGKDFSFHLRIEGIRCHTASFYRWSKDNPELPNFVYGKIYTHEEFEQWREFVKKKPGRQAPKI